MEKLVRGILDFRKNVLPERLETFARLAHGQTPDSLFITCSDSRVAPNWFASTNPGELFVIRNVGNLVPPCDHQGCAGQDFSVPAAIDFSVLNLRVSDIIVCGHSGCGAMHALKSGLQNLPSANLRQWLSSADRPLDEFPMPLKLRAGLSPEDQLSQRNVLQQIENLKTYPTIKTRLHDGSLRLHAWWFDIAQAGVFAFDERLREFVLIDDEVGESLIARNKRDH